LAEDRYDRDRRRRQVATTGKGVDLFLRGHGKPRVGGVLGIRSSWRSLGEDAAGERHHADGHGHDTAEHHGDAAARASSPVAR
jgi:hypothetical protein